MRRLLICAVAVAALTFSTGTPAEAGYSRPVPAGFFGRLMDMERRKNEFLLRLFGLR
jgi:hypothetical protein